MNEHSTIFDFGTAPEQKQDGYRIIGTVIGDDTVAERFFNDVRLVRGANINDSDTVYEFYVMTKDPSSVLGHIQSFIEQYSSSKHTELTTQDVLELLQEKLKHLSDEDKSTYELIAEIDISPMA